VSSKPGAGHIAPHLFEKARTEAIETAGVLLSKAQESRFAISSYRETIASFPRITIQFNQARRQLLDALDENLAFSNETEVGIARFIRELKSYDN
jgi:hypothetical protein